MWENDGNLKKGRAGKAKVRLADREPRVFVA